MRDLLIIVPTRSRPHNVVPVVESWLETGGFEHAHLMFVIDDDDPDLGAYLSILQLAGERVVAEHPWSAIGIRQIPRHQQLVPKLNDVSALCAQFDPAPFAIGFAGDDHRPRTPGWAKRYLDELRQMGTGIVYPDDGYQGENIPTSWAMTTDIVRALGGAQIPAPVEHLFCDNALRDLGKEAGCLRYLPAVLVEHMHPNAPGGKAPTDDQYLRVNSRRQWRADQDAYREWKRRDLPRQAAVVRALMTGETA